MARPPLREVQARFFALITAPEGVASGLPALGMTPSDLAMLIEGDERLDAVGRLDIYAHMYFYRLLDVLRADYPRTLAVVGDDQFHDLVTDFLLACPSENPSARHLGARLPGYLAQHALGQARPWLADLAALEWARTDVFDRTDVPLLRRPRLASLDPERFAELRLQAIPATQILEVGSAVEEVWRQEGSSESRGANLDPPRRAGRILVWRKDVRVLHRVVVESESEWLPALAEGITFGALCEAMGETLGPAEAARLGGGLLAQWLEDEILVDTLA